MKEETIVLLTRKGLYAMPSGKCPGNRQFRRAEEILLVSDAHFQRELSMETRLYHFKSTGEKLIEQIVNADKVQINHLILPQGEKVPEHYSNSNVYLVVVKGTITATLEGEPRKHPRATSFSSPITPECSSKARSKKLWNFFGAKAPRPERYRQSLG